MTELEMPIKSLALFLASNTDFADCPGQTQGSPPPVEH